MFIAINHIELEHINLLEKLGSLCFINLQHLKRFSHRQMQKEMLASLTKFTHNTSRNGEKVIYNIYAVPLYLRSLVT